MPITTPVSPPEGADSTPAAPETPATPPTPSAGTESAPPVAESPAAAPEPMITEPITPTTETSVDETVSEEPPAETAEEKTTE